MSYRNIKPQAHASNASSDVRSQSTSGDTASDSRRSQQEDKEAIDGPSGPKRRRVPGSVTRNACRNCKKARAKCDGKKPCKRCSTRVETSECVYEIHIKNAKEELVKQVKDLRLKDQIAKKIFQALALGENVPDILQRLSNKEPLEKIVESLDYSNSEDMGHSSPTDHQRSTLKEIGNHEPQPVSPLSSSPNWTAVALRKPLFDHLFQLYFAWVHPVHTLFHEGRFVDCYHRGSEDYCSSLLVNAICAMACQLHPVVVADDPELAHLAQEFSDEVFNKMSACDKSVTTIQTLAIMFLVSSACADTVRGSAYLQLATAKLSSIRHQDSDDFGEVLSITTRGVHNLNTEWAQIAFQPPPSSYPPVHSERDDSSDGDLDNAAWFCYRKPHGDPPLRRRSLLGTTNREKTKLAAIVHDVTMMLYNPQSPLISARDVLELYTRFVTWRKEVSPLIANITDSAVQALPHTISLMVWYSSSIVQLLRPLLDLQGFLSPAVEEVICGHAQEGLLLLDEYYRARYSCRFQPVFQMFATLHLADSICRFLPGETPGAGEIGRGFKDGPRAMQLVDDALEESYTGFPIAGLLQSMLRSTANECSIRIPCNVGDAAMKSGPQPQTYRMDELIAACTRPSYTQPVELLTSRYLSTFASDWHSQAVALGFPRPASEMRKSFGQTEDGMGAQHLMQIRNLLNG